MKKGRNDGIDERTRKTSATKKEKMEIKAKNLDQPRPRGRPPKKKPPQKSSYIEQKSKKSCCYIEEIESSSVPKRQVHRTPKRENKMCSFPSTTEQECEYIKVHFLQLQEDIHKIKSEMVTIQVEQARLVATLKNGIKTQQEAIDRIRRYILDIQFEQIVQAEIISKVDKNVS